MMDDWGHMGCHQSPLRLRQRLQFTLVVVHAFSTISFHAIVFFDPPFTFRDSDLNALPSIICVFISCCAVCTCVCSQRSSFFVHLTGRSASQTSIGRGEEGKDEESRRAQLHHPLHLDMHSYNHAIVEKTSISETHCTCPHPCPSHSAHPTPSPLATVRLPDAIDAWRTLLKRTARTQNHICTHTGISQRPHEQIPWSCADPWRGVGAPRWRTATLHTRLQRLRTTRIRACLVGQSQLDCQKRCSGRWLANVKTMCKARVDWLRTARCREYCYLRALSEFHYRLLFWYGLPFQYTRFLHLLCIP